MHYIKGPQRFDFQVCYPTIKINSSVTVPCDKSKRLKDRNLRDTQNYVNVDCYFPVKYWKMKTSVLTVIHILFIIIAISSCRRELEAPEVQNELLTPILSTKLDISKIVPDSLISEDSDGLISLVYRNTIYEASLNAFDELNSREFDRSAKLDQLVLGDRSVVNAITLGQLYPALGLFNGTQQQINRIPNLSFGPVVLDGSAYFDEMTLDSGYMDITIDNGLPTSLSDIEFEIRNQSNNSLVVDTIFDFVAAGGSETRSINIAGKSVESFLEAIVTNFTLDASAGLVLIDTSDAITVTVTTRDLKVYSAKAIFPAQNIIEVGDTNQLTGVGKARITRAIAKSGFVNVEVESTIEDTLYFEYYIPEGLKDGKSFTVKESIPPAPTGGSTNKSFKYDVSGYEFGMTGYPVANSYNLFYSDLIGRIDSTGRKVNITLNDSIRIFVSLSGFIPEYMEGYAGDTTINIGPEIVPLELFDKIDGGTLEFHEVNMSLSVKNGNNVPFNVELSGLKAKNTRNGSNVDIDLATLPNPISVLGASSLTDPWEETWKIDSKDNLNDALSIFPNQFEASLSIATNPDQNANDLSQFGVDSNKLVAYSDIEIPLDFVANGLTLKDTVEFSSKNISRPDGIGSGTLYLSAKNSFPLSAEIELAFIDINGVVLQTLSFDKSIASGSLNQAKESVLAWKFDRDTFDKMLSSDFVIMTASVSTETVDEGTKIYSTMGLDLKLSARFNYTFLAD